MRCSLEVLGLPHFVASVIATFAFLSMAKVVVAADASPPNVLMICVDDLNANVGYLNGNPGADTPAMDAFARRATRYTDAHASATVCVASRASLLWGVKPSTTGITTGWIPAVNQYRQFRRTTSHKNLVQILSENGYRTMGAGKVFHEYQADDWDQSFEQRHLENGFLEYGASAPGVAQPDRRIAAWAESRLREQHAKPFFLAVGFHLPHVPLLVPQRYLDRHPIDEVELQPIAPDDLNDVGPIAVAQASKPLLFDTPIYDVTSEAALREQTQAYLACVRHTDNQLRRVITALLVSAYRNNTVVIFWSDHGYHLGEKRHIGKGTLWNESTHVPLLIWAPGYIARGAVDSPVSLLDVAPTILDIVGIPRPDHFEGESLVGYTGDRLDHVTTFYGDSISYVSSDFRLTLHHDEDGELQETEVYDRVADPLERTNLAAGP